MLCNLTEEGEESCYPCWPEEKETVKDYNGVKVALLSDVVYGDFTVLTLELCNSVR